MVEKRMPINMFADNITSSYIDKMDIPFVIILLSASFIICSVVAFTIDPSHSPSHPLQLQKQRMTSIQREPIFHEVAQKMGKTVLRPGGSEATKHIQAMADIRPGDSVLELSAGLGTAGIELAQKYGAKVLITDIDTSRLDKVTDRINTLGISNLVSVKKVDMFDIDGTLGSKAKFDVAQTEASLTHYPRSRKRQFFKGLANHADKFMLHEIFFKTNDTASQILAEKDMSKVLNIGFKPETVEIWQQLLIDAGYTNIEHVSTGDLAVLNPISLIKDEGLIGFAKIVFNVATHPYERSRMMAVRNEISKHADDLGYITIVASK